MSSNAREFGEAYRDRPLEVEKRAGVEHLVAGQHEAIYVDVDEKMIELSYVVANGHTFVVIMLDAETLKDVGRIKVDSFGLREMGPFMGFKLSDEMMAAVTRLKTEDVQVA